MSIGRTASRLLTLLVCVALVSSCGLWAKDGLSEDEWRRLERASATIDVPEPYRLIETRRDGGEPCSSPAGCPLAQVERIWRHDGPSGSCDVVDQVVSNSRIERIRRVVYDDPCGFTSLRGDLQVDLVARPCRSEPQDWCLRIAVSDPGPDIESD